MHDLHAKTSSGRKTRVSCSSSQPARCLCDLLNCPEGWPRCVCLQAALLVCRRAGSGACGMRIQGWLHHLSMEWCLTDKHRRWLCCFPYQICTFWEHVPPQQSLLHYLVDVCECVCAVVVLVLVLVVGNRGLYRASGVCAVSVVKTVMMPCERVLVGLKERLHLWALKRCGLV